MSEERRGDWALGDWGRGDSESPHRATFWRTLDERVGDPAFREQVFNEFPSLLPTLDEVADPVARRTFL